ncbi:MAG: hypothetical protein G8D28_10615 [gamma proteobacterium symbiont of Phacoides pectinatus]
MESIGIIGLLILIADIYAIIKIVQSSTAPLKKAIWIALVQVCRYLVKDFGTSQSPKSTRQRDSRYCPDRPALITTPSRTLQQSCSCATPS